MEGSSVRRVDRRTVVDPPVDRPDGLDRSFGYFHENGTRIAWWSRGDGYWFVAGHDLVGTVLGDHATFSSRHDVPNGTSPYLGVMLPPGPLESPPLELDPPDHGRLRAILRPRFSTRALAGLRARITRLTDACLDAHADDGELDVYHDLAQAVCATVALELVGLPGELAPVLADAAQVGAEVPESAQVAWGRLFEELVRAVEANRDRPGDSVIGDLCRAGDAAFDNGYVIRTAITVLLGGATSPVKLLLDAFRHLGTHPADQALLARRRDLLPVAVEEFMRIFTPTEMIARTATRDTELGGETIKAGERVVIGLGAANRDPHAFPGPNTVDLRREPNAHLSMGRGIHHCLGAALGRAEVTTILDRALTWLPGFELASDPGEGRLAMGPLVIRF